MTEDIGWRFPPTNGGAGDGYNDSGIAHFSGAPLSSLARETIQNSLDARKSRDEPVHVSFELLELGRDVEFGRRELLDAIAACMVSTDCTDVARSQLVVAKALLSEEAVPCLRVSDRNTSGLRDGHWRALVKTRGLSIKAEQGAGGSHGIGKAAPFAVTPLRTVFYWTHYVDGGRGVERFQGKSVLMSHEADGVETQGTGFFGAKEGCREVRGGEIPSVFRLVDGDGTLVEGTILHILGFRAGEDWRRRIARSVVGNYFYAIATGKLDVIVEPDDAVAEANLDQIDQDSLSRWFSFLQEEESSEDVAEEGGGVLSTARALWEISSGEVEQVEKQDLDLGHCRLWIKVEEGLPNRVGFVRNTGMLITTQQRNLIRFSGFRDFAALCVFEDPDGNELLREMENPQHDQFEPDRLPDDERSRGRRALNRITRWIREELRKRAGPPESTGRTVLSELAAYLPDLHPDDNFDDDGPETEGGTREQGFGDRVTIRLKPNRANASAQEEHDSEGDDFDGDGDDTGDAGGSGTGEPGGGGSRNGSGEGEGEGEGGTGGRGGRIRRKPVRVTGVRLLPIAGHANRYRLSFRAESSRMVRLELHEAGDSSPIARRDVRAIAADGEAEASLDAVQLTDGGRTELMVTADEQIGGRSWRLSAFEVGKE